MLSSIDSHLCPHSHHLPILLRGVQSFQVPILMAQELDCQTVLAKSKHSATVIFLHVRNFPYSLIDSSDQKIGLG